MKLMVAQCATVLAVAISKDNTVNNRFKEIAAQAEEYATEKARDGFSNYNLVYDRKYAELIVQECAAICDRQGHSGWNDDRKAQARLDRDLIKEHFGVK